MNALELNKIVGAILAALVFAMGLSVLSEIIFEPGELYEPAYVVAIANQDTGLAAEEEAEVPFAELLSVADAAAGKGDARVCAACHTFNAGGANGIGPNLHDVVGRPIASHEGFNYSAALKTYGEGKDWTYDELDAFLESPQQHVKGTIMGYAGLKDPAQRADVVAYLKEESPDGPPLPEPPAEVAAVDAASTATDASAEGAEAVVPPQTDATEAVAPPQNDGTPGQEGAQEGTDGTFAAMVAAANPADGQAAAAICLACHSVNAGEAHKIGPNLHGVFGAAVASKDGFDYSDAMKNHAVEDGEWTLAHLDSYLKAPMEMVPGGRMVFPGVKDDAQRAAIIAWLHSLSPDAGAIDAAVAAEAAAPEGGAGEAAPAAPEAGTGSSGEAQTPPAESTGEQRSDAAPAAGSDAAPATTGSDAASATGGDATPATTGSDAASATGEARQRAAAALADAAVDAQNVTIEPARRSQVEVVNPKPAAN